MAHDEEETIGQVLDALVPGHTGRLEDLVAGHQACKRIRVVNSRRGGIIVAALRAEPHNLSWTECSELLGEPVSTLRNWAKPVLKSP